jgi:indole-3-glycerol phosphate synthase
VSDFLETIVARTRERVRDLREADPRGVDRKHAFANALLGDRIRVIAEIKSASPSAGPIIDDPDVEAIARDYKSGGASAISIVTEPEFFRGSQQWIARAAESGLPVLMKDFIIDERQLMCGVAAGASAILLLASLLDAIQIREFSGMLHDYGVDALVEVHDERELDRAMRGEAKIIGVNNRNLRDFKVDLATAETLGARIPSGVIKVAESGIKTKADVDRLRAAGFNAFLVGESLLRQNDRATAVKALIS